jgi:hypothetical protein
MAIISIPSSIGGVTIPGSVTNGPLGMLFGKKGGGNLQYPRDLGSATRGHSVRFEIVEVQPVGYQEGKETNFSSIGTGISESVKNVASAYSSAEGFGNGVAAAASKLTLEPPKSKIVQTIDLYMPETMAFQYNASYNDIELKSAIQEAVQGAAGMVSKTAAGVVQGVSGAVDSDAAKLVLKTQGLAVNPMKQLVFQGIDFREFQMAFTFTPYSKQEAQTVKKIIQAFRTAAAPTINKGTGGMFFIPPSVLNIKFLFKGKENPNVNKVTEAAITGIDVNFAPNGWSTYSDGAPVQTTMTVTFRENALVDRNKIKEGY